MRVIATTVLYWGCSCTTIAAIAICYLCAGDLYSQDTTKVKPQKAGTKDKDIKKLYQQAEAAFYKEDYRLALALYNKLMELSPEEDQGFYSYQIALCYLYSNTDNEKAITYIDLAEESVGTGENADLYYYHLGRAFHLNHRFDDAIDAYNKALTLGAADTKLMMDIEHQIVVCKYAKELVKDAKNIKIYNAGAIINSGYPDYKPVISADESVLMFTSRKGAEGEKLFSDGRYYEDIYISYKDSLGYWTEPDKISDHINSPDHEASVGLSPDGQELYIYKGNPHTGGLYVCRLEGNKWSQPQKVEGSVNSKKFWETSASVSSDGSTIYFSSNRPGGMGERDIYMAKLLPDGKWGKETHLGSAINSPYDEDSPFIHPDGKTLYFSSKGHKNIGGFDVFKSVFENGKWSAAQNMGYPLNSTADEAHFVITANGKNAFFSSSRTGGYGETDVYKVFLDGGVPLILVKGIIRAEETPLKAKINVMDKSTQKPLKYVYDPNPATGKYLLILPPGKEYDMVITAQSYDPYIVNIKVPDENEFFEMYQEITLSHVTTSDNKGGQQVTVLNSFKKPEKDSIAEVGKRPDNEYMETLVQRIVSISDTTSDILMEKPAELLSALEKVDIMTDNAITNFNTLVLTDAVTDAFTSTTVQDDPSVKKEQITVNGETISAISSRAFTPVDMNKKTYEIKVEKAGVEKQKEEREIEKLKIELSRTTDSVLKTNIETKITFKEERVIEKEAFITGKTTQAIVEQRTPGNKEILAAEKELAKFIAELREIKKTESAKPANVKTEKKNEKVKQLETVIVQKEAAIVEKQAKMTGKLPHEIVLGRKAIQEEIIIIDKKKSEQELAKLRKELEQVIKSIENNIAKADAEEKQKEIEDAMSKWQAEIDALDNELIAVQKAKEEAVKAAAIAAAEKAKSAAVIIKADMEKEKVVRDSAGLLGTTTVIAVVTEKAKADAEKAKVAAEKFPIGLPVMQKVVHFDFNKADILNQYKMELDDYITSLLKSPSVKVQVDGHTDSKGPEQYNYQLSLRRARSVANYLMTKGIKKQNIIIKGYGETRPVAPNSHPDNSDNPDGRAQNRRTEILAH